MRQSTRFVVIDMWIYFLSKIDIGIFPRVYGITYIIMDLGIVSFLLS